MKNGILLKSLLVISERLEIGTRRKHFPGLTIPEIRDELEKLGIDRHILIEAKTTEVAVITPKGILMQIRGDEHNILSLWGGFVRDNEEPDEAAIRRLYEEAGVVVNKEQLKFVDHYTHSHTYENGDKCHYLTYRYTVHLDYVPEVVSKDNSTLGGMLIKHTIPNTQLSFVHDLLWEFNEVE